MSSPGASVRPGVIVHGGAGAGAMDPARLERYRAGLAEAAQAGHARLAAGGSSLDAAEAAVRAMEASGAFNAGLGSCLNLAREVECDAAVMLGEDLRAGAVGALRGYRHPVTLARRILEETDHVLVVGEGAARLAEGFALEPWDGKPTAERLREYDDVAALFAKLPRGEKLARLTTMLRHGAEAKDAPPRASGRLRIAHGDTVGAVAIDGRGRIAATVSTGGLWLKAPGRVGDAGLPGAGIYADDRAGGVSATGIGEAIIRVALARAAVEAMERHEGPGSRALAGVEAAIARLSARIGEDTAGIIAIDREGRPAAAMNTEAMGRAYMGADMAAPAVAVARDERFV